MTEIRDTGRSQHTNRDEQPRVGAAGAAAPDGSGSGPIVERYAAAKAAAKVVVDAPSSDAVARHELMVAALVALMDSVGDVPVLLRALRAARLRAANLAAAGRATLAADQDGESDPLYYLRDQLDHDQDDGPDADQAGAVVP